MTHGLSRPRKGAGGLPALGLGLLLSAGLAAGVATAATADLPRRPERIVLVSVDGLAGEWATAGRMPALAALLERGAGYRRGRSPSNLTFPALTALLSGRAPAATGVTTEGAAGFPGEGAALAPALASLGYRGLALPADPFAHSGSGIARGFARFLPEAPALADSARVDTALAWLAQPGRRFAWLGLSFGEAEADWRRADGPAFAPGGREARAREIDAAIGRLVAGLGRAGLASGTLLAIVGTHGLPGDGDPLGVPIAFVRLGGTGSAGGGAPAEAGLVDVAPTLVRIGGGRPEGFDGRALPEGSAGARAARSPAAAAPAAESASPCRSELLALLGGGGAPRDSVTLGLLRALAERCPDDRRVAIEEADALSRAGREGEAARRFLAMGERWPQEPVIALGYARHLVRHGRFEMVAAALAPVPPTSPFATEAAWMEVTALAGQLRFTAAAAAARRAATLAVPRGSYLSAATALERLHEAQVAAEARPGDYAAQLAFGRELGEFGLFAEAYRRLHRARGGDSTRAEPDFRIAALLQREGRFEPAARTLERALATDPTHRDSRVALAEVLIRLDRWREAVPHLERCVAEDPADAVSAYNLACLLARDGRSDDALRALRRAVDAGYDRWDVMAGDPDLAPLRERAEFRELLARRATAE